MRPGRFTLALVLLATGCFRATVRSGHPPGETPAGYDQKWHSGYLAGTVEGSGPHRLDRLCPAGWAEVSSETDPLQSLLHLITLTIYAPQTVQVVCRDQAPPTVAPPSDPSLP